MFVILSWLVASRLKRETARVRVATWNIWWRYGEPDRRAPLIQAALEELDADVIGLQEVWHRATDDGSTDDNSARRLAEALGYQCAYVASPNPTKWQTKLASSDFGIGNAVLSRWPIIETASVNLPAGGAADEGRVGLMARIDTPTGVLPFFTTHLNSAWAQSSIRSSQLAKVGELILDRGMGDPYPPVLCGDLNATDDFDEVRSLVGKRDALVEGLVLVDTWPYLHRGEPGYTWDRTNPYVDATNEPDGRIDYILTGFPTTGRKGRAASAGLFGNESSDGVWPSDHFGVWADLATESSSR